MENHISAMYIRSCTKLDTPVVLFGNLFVGVDFLSIIMVFLRRDYNLKYNNWIIFWGSVTVGLESFNVIKKQSVLRENVERVSKQNGCL